MDKVTAPSVRAAKGGDKLRMITAYDAPSARVADRAGADIILVGDSLANVVLGYESTPQVTMDEMIHHTAAVTRTGPRALVVGDMPWLSYHITPEETVRNAGRFVQEGGVGAVKLEGGAKRVETIRVVLDAEIPVMGHIGLTPQSVHAMGGYKVQGRGLEAAHALIADGVALADAGVFSIVLEGVPDVVAAMITEEVPVPTIGIGAGSDCDGQVLVYHDVLGLHDGHLPKFVRKYAELADTAVDALERFFADIQSGEFPSDEETYHLSDEVAAALREGRKLSSG
jgi:3-methyl-2-oxobutanoate hydroxymethyltransferase